MVNNQTQEALTETPAPGDGVAVTVTDTKKKKSGMLLQINAGMRITCTDGMNFVPERRIVAPEELRGKPSLNAGKVTWKGLGYLPTLELALVSSLKHATSEAGHLDMSEMIAFLKQTKLDIVEAVRSGNCLLYTDPMKSCEALKVRKKELSE